MSWNIKKHNEQVTEFQIESEKQEALLVKTVQKTLSKSYKISKQNGKLVVNCGRAGRWPIRFAVDLRLLEDGEPA